MAKQRLINTRFWDDGYVSNLDPIEKLLFIYFLTNAQTNICGIYELSLKKMAMETGIEKEMVEKVIKRFSNDNKIFYIEGWVCIKNFLKHQLNSSPKVKVGIENELSFIPSHILDKAIEYGYGIDTVSHLNLNSNLNLNTNVKATKVAYTEADMELSKLLLERIRANTPTYKEPNLDKWASESRLMRERDGRTEEQIRFLINWSQKDLFWQANILSMRKLREKFDTLVAQVKRTANKSQVKKANVAF